jgi:hypothetical protein
MSAHATAAATLANAAQLVADLKAEQDTIDLAEARRLLSVVVQARGWLLSAEELLMPGQTLGLI